MSRSEQARTIAAALIVVVCAIFGATCNEVETVGPCDPVCPETIVPADCQAVSHADLLTRCDQQLPGSRPELIEREACVPIDCYPARGGLFVSRFNCGGNGPRVEFWCVPGGGP